MNNRKTLGKRIGSRLKSIRKDLRMTIRQLAELAELSPSLVSRIENGVALPSLMTLQAIADALGVEIDYFIRRNEESGFVISYAGKRRSISVKKQATNNVQYEVEYLCEGMEDAYMEPIISTLVGNREDMEMVSHSGQDFIYMLEGKMELSLGKLRFILKKGDAAYFDSHLPHKGISLSKKPAKSLNVHLVPGKRNNYVIE